jgi:hypothetical protein
MAVHLAQQDRTLAEEELKPAVDQVRVKLSRQRNDFRFDEVVARLEAMGILCPKGEGQWAVRDEQLTEAINREHLASYLRRLR